MRRCTVRVHDNYPAEALFTEFGSEIHKDGAERRGRTAYVPANMKWPPGSFDPLAPGGIGGKIKTFQTGFLAAIARPRSSVRRSLEMPSVRAGR